jgi:plastocyanin
VLGCGLVAALSTSAATSNPNRGLEPQTHVVTLEGMGFNPANLAVRKGDRVTWVNKDLFPHTATATAPAAGTRKAFDSHSIAPGASWTFVAGKAGDYSYGCAFHPTMKGRLTVR